MSKLDSALKACIAAGFAFAAVVVTANPAAAMDNSVSGWTYKSSDLCVYNETHFEDGDTAEPDVTYNNLGTVQNRSRQNYSFLGYDLQCDSKYVNRLTVNARPAGYMRNYSTLWYWDGYMVPAGFSICAGTGWQYTPAKTADYEIITSYTTARCGYAGLYEFQGGAQVENGTTWYGGPLVTNQFYMQ